MAWLTLALRKQTLKAQITELNYDDIQLSRRKRSVHRHLSYEQSTFNSMKTAELRNAKSEYLEIRNRRPDIDSEEYEEWKVEYSAAQEDYQSEKAGIEDYYEDLNQEAEAEAEDEENALDDEITRVETQRDAMNAELQAITDQIKTEIEASAIKF